MTDVQPGRERDRYTAILDAVGEGVLQIDSSGRVFEVNAAARRILSLEPGRSPEFLLDDRFSLKVVEPGASLLGFADLAPIAPQSIEGTLLDRHGKRIPISGSLSKIEGDAPAWLLTFRDERERISMLDELRKSRDEALRSARVKADFLANMSHEIRTPLNGVIGMAGLLLDTELSSEQHEYARTVRSSADTLLSLLNDILDFSKIEAGKLELELADFDLYAVLGEIGDMTAPLAHQKNLELAIAIDPRLPRMLRGDPTRLRQVLLNLTNNAVKFTERGEVVLSVAPSERSGDGAVRFSVRDTGLGIARDRLYRLFRPFSQVDASMTRRHGGTGLGLVICRELVSAMGGEIIVQSKVAAGSTFSFVVPLPAAVVQPEQSPALGGKVLVVDDNATSRQIAAGLLESWGCRTVVADSAQSALEELDRAVRQRDRFTLVVLDHQLGDLDALDLAELIKSERSGPPPPLLLATSLWSGEIRGRAKTAGFAGSVTKPLRPDQLHAATALAIGARQAKQIAPPDRVGPLARSAKILLVEDNPVNQRVASRILEKAGHRCDFAINGAQAIVISQQARYDLLLMDCQMPETDGYDATREIRRLERARGSRRTPIVAMTAEALTGDRERCLEAGMDDYLSKPVQAKALLSKIDHYLVLRSPRTDAQLEPPPLDFARLEDAIGDRRVIREILSVFVRDTKTRLERMTQLSAKSSFAELADETHAVKGSSGNVGAMLLHTTASALDKALRDGASDGAEKAIASMHSQLGEVERALAGF